MNLEKYGREIVELNDEMLKQRRAGSPSYVSTCNKLLKRAKEIGDEELLGYSYYFLSDAYYIQSSDYRKFTSNLLRALEILQNCGNLEHLARSYNLLGIDALNHGNSDLALDFFLTALRYSEDIEGVSSAAGIIQFNLGQIYYTYGDIKQGLLYVKDAYRNIKRDKSDGLYHRNSLYCFCFQINCFIELEKPADVDKCLQALDKLEQDPDAAAEFSHNFPLMDARMRGNYYLGRMDLYYKYEEDLLKMLVSKRLTFDLLEDAYASCRFFIKQGYYDRLPAIFDNIEETINISNIPNLRKGFAALKIEYYDIVKDTERKNAALLQYYESTIEQEKEKFDNYKFFINIRTRLAAIEKENRILQQQAETDPLTGLGNRYSLNKYAETAFDESFEKQKSLAVEILDVDNFKQYNDNFGHQAGDECLKLIGTAIMDLCNSREGIKGFRYGGDEFVIIYDNMTDDEIMTCARALRDRIASVRIGGEAGIESGVTISQGIRNSVPSQTNKLWDYMYTADNALYEVKEHGKGEVAILHKAVISQTSLDDAQHS